MKMLGPGRFDLAEQKRNIWRVNPEDDTPLEAVLEPSYWTRYVNRLRPYDIIEVINDQATYFAKLMVLQVGITTAIVKQLECYELVPDIDMPEEASARYEYKWRGPRGHSILDKKTQAVVQEKLPSKEAAAQWISEHMKMAAQAVA